MRPVNESTLPNRLDQVQPEVTFVGGLERRCNRVRPAIPVSAPVIGHIDDRPVVGFDDLSHIEQHRTTRSGHGPVGTRADDGAFKQDQWSFELLRHAFEQQAVRAQVPVGRADVDPQILGEALGRAFYGEIDGPTAVIESAAEAEAMLQEEDSYDPSSY